MKKIITSSVLALILLSIIYRVGSFQYESVTRYDNGNVKSIGTYSSFFSYFTHDSNNWQDNLVKFQKFYNTGDILEITNYNNDGRWIKKRKWHINGTLYERHIYLKDYKEQTLWNDDGVLRWMKQYREHDSTERYWYRGYLREEILTSYGYDYTETATSRWNHDRQWVSIIEKSEPIWSEDNETIVGTLHTESVEHWDNDGVYELRESSKKSDIDFTNRRYLSDN